MKVVIAEKPSVARDLAKILKANNRKDGYLEGNGYQVTWAIGHLVQLAEPKVYGWEKWSLKDLPMLPQEFKLMVSANEGIKRQFNIIKYLFEKCDAIIVATDAGREGELIFRYIYQLSGCQKPFQRLWISSLTDSAIEEGFRKLEAGSKYDNLYYAARCRSEADWLVGMNATRAITLSSGSRTPISIGRVQTPTLALICERYLENKNFTPVPFFELFIHLEKEAKKFKAKHVKNFKTEQEAEEAKAKISPDAECTKVEKKKKTEQAPLLFDLTSLQQETNKKFGYTAQRTLDIAQELYETHKLITYPRTGSSYLSDDMYKQIPILMKNVGQLDKYKSHTETLLKEPISKRPVNNAKVTDHHAIIPTEKSPVSVSLSKEVQKVYDLIVSRFLAAFSKPCEKEITTYEFTSGGLLFKASGTVIVFAGWRTLEIEEKSEKEDEKDEEEDDQKLPKVAQGEILPIQESEVANKMTKPKALYTEASLLKIMETAGKDLEDNELRDAMKQNGLGTPATRASIIETLFKREYIERDKKKIAPTSKGLQVYEIIKDKPISSAELTGRWEKGLNFISEGKADHNAFMQGIFKYATEVVQEFAANSIAILDGPPCPKCSKFLKNTPKAFSCQDKECGFILWKTISGKELPLDVVKCLLDKQETKLMKGFKNKEGKSFEAALFLKEDFTVGYKFSSQVIQDTKYKCPKCQALVKQQGKLLKCSGEACDFTVWKEVAGKKLPEKVIAQIMAGKTTELIEGFTSKAGKKFSAHLELKDFKVTFVFEKKENPTNSEKAKVEEKSNTSIEG